MEVTVKTDAIPEAASALGEPLGIAAAAHLIGCSVWTLRQRLLPLGLPYFRSAPNGRLIFYREQVVQWVLTQQSERRR